MKKLKSQQKIRAIALARSKFCKKLHRAKLRYSCPSSRFLRKMSALEEQQLNFGVAANIPLPSSLSFDKSATDLLAWVNEFRKKSQDSDNRIICDFVPVSQVGIAGALVVTAELDNWRQHQWIGAPTTKRLVPVNLENRQPEVKRIFLQLGLFKILRVRGATDMKAKQPPAQLEVLRFISGQKCQGHQAEKVFNWFKKLGVDIKSAKTPLESSIMEAMSNVAEHAYLAMKTKDVNLVDNWWMSASFDRSSRVLEVLLYDRGVTIPASFKHKDLWLRIISIFSPINDAKLIRSAMEKGKSITGKRHRGHGLSDMKKAVENGQIPNSRLRIISGYGACTVTPMNTMSLEVFERPLPGTLLNWRLELD